MKLNDFEQYLDRAVVERGLQYYRENRVEDLAQQPEGLFAATVEGSDDYSVTVRLSDAKDIVEAGCDCPYTGGPYCKHMVAVFFALSAQANPCEPTKPAESGDVPFRAFQAVAGLKKQTDLLEDVLSRQPHEKLVALLLALASANPTVADQIAARFSSDNGDTEKWVELIKSHIRHASDGHGFIDYRHCGQAVQGAEIVLDTAQSAFADEEYEYAVDLALCVMGEMVELLEQTDDSDGTVEGVIEEADNLLSAISSEVPAEMQEICFYKVLYEAGQKRYDDWSEFRMALLQICTGLTTSGTQRTKLEQFLQQFAAAACKDRPGSLALSNYDAEQAILLRSRLIQRFDGEIAFAKFLLEHRRFPKCRELAIKAAIEAKDYSSAEDLALEGEKQDAKLPGLVKAWKSTLLDIYKLQPQPDKAKTICQELALEGDFTHYKKLKELYAPAQWQQIYPEILLQLEKSRNRGHNIYTAAVVEEQEWEKLLEYVRQNPREVLNHYRHLLPDYREQVFEIFRVFILDEAAGSSNRRDYQHVCSHLRLLVKIGGNQPAALLVRALLSKYSHRPAFCDELQRV